ncbi:MAG TPA: 4Fe-4S dicluster domain-containing protein [Chloroflexota bacterium]|nr:4Fe-4S dicluster domain-containing protein [Chloroflexota bacterium]
MRRADRRGFLKLAGLVVVGAGIKPTVDLLAGPELAEASRSGVAGGRAGRRLAMAIDLPACIAAGDCTECIAACNAAHNIPHFDDPKEEIKWIWRDGYANAFPDSANSFVAANLRNGQVTLLCNHCDNPPCVRVCPTQATWKREDGIVMMDEHRCIGCRYCTVACPYGARSFNYRDPRQGLDMKTLTSDFPTRTRGVVEKCNFCVERIDKGQPPACVEACRRKAMFFGDLNDAGAKVRELLASRPSIRRNPGLGTDPQLYYLV